MWSNHCGLVKMMKLHFVPGFYTTESCYGKVTKPSFPSLFDRLVHTVRTARFSNGYPIS